MAKKKLPREKEIKEIVREIRRKKNILGLEIRTPIQRTIIDIITRHGKLVLDEDGLPKIRIDRDIFEKHYKAKKLTSQKIGPAVKSINHRAIQKFGMPIIYVYRHKTKVDGMEYPRGYYELLIPLEPLYHRQIYRGTKIVSRPLHGITMAEARDSEGRKIPPEKQYPTASEPTDKKFYGLPILKEPHPLTPKNIYYEERRIMGGITDAELVARLLSKKTPVLLIGPHGTGKNTLINYIAEKTNRPVIRIPFEAGMDENTLLGYWAPDPSTGGIKWIDGPLTKAVKMGAIVVLDEVNFASPDILATLHQLLEPNGKLVLKLKGGEIVEPHPEFRVVATMNPSGEYAGTVELNQAFEDRFVRVHLPRHPENTLKKILRNTLKNLSKKQVDMLIDLYVEANKWHERGRLSKPISIRKLIQLGNAIAGLPHKQANETIKYLLYSHYDLDEAKTVSRLINTVLRQSRQDQSQDEA